MASIKGNQISLSNVKELPEPIIKKLVELSITTCEEFVSSVGADFDSFAKYVNVDKQQLIKYHDIISKRLNKNILDIKDSQKESPNYFYNGALSPLTDEFQKYVQKSENKTKEGKEN